MIVIAGLHSTRTPNTVCDCCFAIAMAIAVASLHSSSIINNNNVNTPSIKTITNNVSFLSLHRPHVRVHIIEGLSCMGMASGINGVAVADGVQYGVVIKDDIALTCCWCCWPPIIMVRSVICKCH